LAAAALAQHHLALMEHRVQIRHLLDKLPQWVAVVVVATYKMV
jgi:hypothetical protein